MTPRTENHRRRPPLRLFCFRLAAITLALSVLVLVEGALAVLDWGRATEYGDPFVGFSSTRPLFVLNSEEDVYEIPPARQTFFQPDSFAASKKTNEFRIFCLGGSTVQGRPFSIETSFTKWLELSLNAADARRVWEVVNCGGISYASYRLVPILEEVLEYDPDLIIVYTGHNEFLEDRSYAHIKDRPAVVSRVLEKVSQLRTFVLLRHAYLSLRGQPSTSPADDDERPRLSTEVEALLDYRGGLEFYRRDEKWRRDVVTHFHHNLKRMVNSCAEAEVPLWFVDPVCNLRSCPPFKCQHRDDLTAADLKRWTELREQASLYYKTDLPKAVGLLTLATQIDDQHAAPFYDLGKCYERMGDTAKARDMYLGAKELDICPLRIIEPAREAIIDTSRRTSTTLIDVKGLFDRECRDGIPGGYLLIDHVHPSITGHQMVAELFMQEFVKQGYVQPSNGWESTRDETYDAHLDSLTDFYYAHGQERLEGLRLWAQGRATLERPDAALANEGESDADAADSP